MTKHRLHLNSRLVGFGLALRCGHLGAAHKVVAEASPTTAVSTPDRTTSPGQSREFLFAPPKTSWRLSRRFDTSIGIDVQDLGIPLIGWGCPVLFDCADLPSRH